MNKTNTNNENNLAQNELANLIVEFFPNSALWALAYDMIDVYGIEGTTAIFGNLPVKAKVFQTSEGDLLFSVLSDLSTYFDDITWQTKAQLHENRSE